MIGLRKLVIPKPGLVIRDPGNRGKKLAPTGRVVVVDDFWLRRIADGDVEVREAPGPTEARTARQLAAASKPPAPTPRQRAAEAHAQATVAAEPAPPAIQVDAGDAPDSIFHPDRSEQP